MGQKYAAYDTTGAIAGFYDDGISPPPNGALVARITSDQHKVLLEGQAKGKRLAINAQGEPVLLDPLPASADELANVKRAERDAALVATDWLIARHQDETFARGDTTLTQPRLDALLAYRKALRDLPNAPAWPEVELPAAPDFMTAGA
ncbi:phage tail protein [Trinickia terrae]|uniref:Phage tail protein n=1 Tax=Trinickia terrae TaxID=2571161 RepID=A0A4U1HPY1_9BURK|nr:phage tail assembly chaperone [Trinickia terrae]TKC83455.1 phage tail protein [Trinickia terrae]